MKTIFKLNNRPNTQGEFPLVLRITKDRKSNYIFLQYRLRPNYWLDEEQLVDVAHPQSKKINFKIQELTDEAKFAEQYLERTTDYFTAKDIKNLIIRKNKSITFFEVAQQRLDNLEKAGKIVQFKSDRSKICNIGKFHKGELDFRQITPKFLEDFDLFLHVERKMKAKRSRDNHMMLIRTLYNKAIRDGHIDPKHYPFRSGKFQISIKPTLKVGLTEAEVKKIENLKLQKGSRIFDTRNAWLFSFYNAGIRAKDLYTLKWQEVLNENLGYSMSKNQKFGVTTLHQKAIKILKIYKSIDQALNDYVFPFLTNLKSVSSKDLNSQLNTVIHNTNKDLKKIAVMVGIEKNLYNHCARHTFGNIAMNKIDIRSLQKLFRHSSIKTTEQYQRNFKDKNVDDDLNNVINF